MEEVRQRQELDGEVHEGAIPQHREAQAHLEREARSAGKKNEDEQSEEEAAAGASQPWRLLTNHRFPRRAGAGSSNGERRRQEEAAGALDVCAWAWADPVAHCAGKDMFCSGFNIALLQEWHEHRSGDV